LNCESWETVVLKFSGSKEKFTTISDNVISAVAISFTDVEVYTLARLIGLISYTISGIIAAFYCSIKAFIIYYYNIGCWRRLAALLTCANDWAPKSKTKEIVRMKSLFI